MDSSKIFACPGCDANIPVEDLPNTDVVICNHCSRRYRLEYVEREAAWELFPIEPVEEGPEEPVESDSDQPFEVLQEPAGPRKDDLDKL
jgi:hypothetical protein